MTKSLLVALLAAALAAAPAAGAERKKGAKKKPEVGASCKAPALGACAACSITCRAGETASCAPGLTTGDTCHPQPLCKCTR